MAAADDPASLLRPLFLEAKLHPPTPRPEHVSRPQLLRSLDDGAARPLTLVAAPAGFGKSTLLAEWCAQGAGGRRSAWLSLDEGDNDPVVFWSYVLHALRRVVPTGFEAGQAALARPGVSLTRTVLPGLLNELWSLPEPLVLVLDDYHELTNAECHASLEFFLRRLPSNIHLVIATRSDPPLGLAALRARGNLTELRAAALRFTEVEAATLLNDRLALNLTAPDLARLADRTEGWAAGLYLAALSLRGRPDTSAFIAAFAGDHRYLVDYLSSEVLDRLSAGTRAFLVRSSILESFSASLCCEVTGLADGAERLMELRRTNQFLIGLDDRGEWFRYHHLFAELLRMELVQTEPELAPELHRRAAAWYRTQGNAVAAMRHALAVPDYALAAAIFIESAHPLCEMARFATVEGWMRQFPEPSITAHPRLALAMAWIAAEAYRPKADVERWLAIAAASDFPGPVFLGSRTMQSNVAIVHAGYLFDDIGRAVRAGELAVQEETDPTQYSYMLARGSFGEALYFAGRPAEARRFLEEAIAAPLAHRQTSGKTFWLALLAMASLDLGEPSRAEDLARQSVQLREQMGLTDHLFHWTSSLALAMVLCRQNRFTEAEAVLAEGVEPYLPALGDWRVFQALALLILAPVRYARGHAEAANSLLDEVRAMIAACPDPGMLPALLATTERSLHRLPRRATGLRQDLSDGELRVLRLLASDLNQREISRELYLSVNTVKTHARNIYTKLDAGSRAEAVTRARALGLIA